MELYADVIIDISHEKVDRPFQYRIPDRLRMQIRPGVCVQVPFGRGNTLRKGYVIGIGSKCEFDPSRIKDILAVAEDAVGVEANQIRLADWIHVHYGSTMIQALKTVLPSKHTVRQVEHKKIVLKVSKEEAISYLGECIRKKQKGKVRLLEELVREKELPQELVTGKLMIASTTLKSLESAGILSIEVTKSFRNPVKEQDTEGEDKVLSPEQEYAVRTVMEDGDKGRRGVYLLHGITGSGKTEVYIRLVEETIKRGKQAIVLIPEIALTYQTLMRFYRKFQNRVSVINSTLSAGERYDQCERAKRGEIDVIIGPRSALFVPFPNLGLILMDEEHESSYKSESMPRYHAREVAVELGRMHGAQVVLGSATPSMEAFYRARKGEYKLLTLTRRLTGGELPGVYVVDLREELRQGNRSIFSNKLTELMEDRLRKGQQTMLFLNRRGFAGFISCRACGHVMKCPHCDVSLSQHKNGQLVCHYCGYEQPGVNLCPECGSRYISGFRAGTEQIVDKLQEMFPTMRILRMDADTTRTKDSYEQILSAFRQGEADVLVGTQMIVKGHDFPNVTLVGILAADLSLSLGDYRAGEKTFQLLTQAAGRAGRGTTPGEVVVQTYQPDHYAITYAARQDYNTFYEEEILYRDMMGYPPVQHMLAVWIGAQVEEEGAQVIGKLADYVRELSSQEAYDKLQILGPTAAAIGKIKDIYRFVLYLKQEEEEILIAVKDQLTDLYDSMERKKVSIAFDFDPMNPL